MAVFTCFGAQLANDLFVNCSSGVVGISGTAPWIGSSCSVGGIASCKGTTNFISTGSPADRTCGTYSQPDVITAQWVGTLTYGVAACIASAANFEATGCGVSTGTMVVGGDFAAIPVSASDSIQFTISLNIT